MQEPKDFVLDRFPERGQDYVGINNGNAALEGFIFLAEDLVCQWWDDHSFEARICGAAGGYVFVPYQQPSDD